LQIVNSKFKSVHILKKDYDDITTNFFDNIKKKDVSKYILPSDYFDCIVLGGGIRGYYVYGSLILLKKMMDIGTIKIRKFIGTSAGAFLSVFIFSNIDPKIIRNVNNFAIKNNLEFSIDKIMLKACWELLPDNIHELINGKVTILISKSLLSKEREQYIDHFDSKLHLMQILHASSYIPFLTTSNFRGISIKGERYFDGIFSNNNPTNFDNDIPQLVFHTWDVDYPLASTLNFNDNFPELIIMRGLLEFEKFIKNLENHKYHENKKIPIKWIDTLDKIHSLTQSNKKKKSVMNETNNETELLDNETNSSKIIKTKKYRNKFYNHLKEYNNFKKNVESNRNINKILLIFFLTISEIISMVKK
jgi:hypothetical protein